jgi:hypothetical protein
MSDQHSVVTGLGAATRTVYTYTLKSFKITDTRARHNDTDFVSMAVKVGANPPITAPTKSMGDVNNGTHQGQPLNTEH